MRSTCPIKGRRLEEVSLCKVVGLSERLEPIQCFSSSASRPVRGMLTPNCTFPTSEVRAHVLSHGGMPLVMVSGLMPVILLAFPERVVMAASLSRFDLHCCRSPA